MKHLNKIASAFCAAVLGMLALTSCEGGDLYKMSAPDWIAEKVDSIKQANTPEELEGMMDDLVKLIFLHRSGRWVKLMSFLQILSGTQSLH